MKKPEDLIDALVLIIITGFLLTYFKPELLLSISTATGGDTASHYYGAQFMKDNLLSSGKISGWTHGNYGGFPGFQFYFFLPFLLMAILGYIIPLEIAFKLVTVLGIFLLPISAYFSSRLMRFRFPIPILSAVFTLSFLFMEANSMWGGNIPSTLAGEFTYSISLALTVLYFGILYREIEKEKGNYVLPLLLLVLITFTHVYTLLFAVLSSGFFLLERNKEKLIKNLLMLFKVNFVAFLLTGFWIIPMVLRLEYTTSFAIVWNIGSIKEVFPDILLPFYLLSIIGFGVSIIKKEKRIHFISFSLLISVFLFFMAEKLGVVDIRFVPFLQLFPLIISAYGFNEITKGLKGQKLLPLIAILATILWVNSNVAFIPHWIEWNYEGFENKGVWNSYNGVNQFLNGSFSDPRVVYEHTQLHNSAGTPRAFESLPLFSGRATLEGLYMQSTISSPFVFYIQSEVSEIGSCPFPPWPCTSFDLDRASKHLAMFNVKDIIARSESVKDSLKKHKGYSLEKYVGSYGIYEVLSNENRYVIVPDYEPVLFETDRWKETSYLWFMDFDENDVHLVFTDDAIKHEGIFRSVIKNGRLEALPRKKMRSDCRIKEEILDEEILFQTSCEGVPHIIRFSYFPNWKIEGAEEIYLVSPSFMLVVPSQENVRLYYSKTFVEYLGMILTLTGLILIFLDRKLDFDWEGSVQILLEKHWKAFLSGILILILLFSIFQLNGRVENQLMNDLFGKELALATNRFTICDVRINDESIKEECFSEVALATNDFNLCDVKIKSPNIRDDCFSNIAIKTEDVNLCEVKIGSNRRKDECITDVAISMNDLNLCISRVSSPDLKEKCKESIISN